MGVVKTCGRCGVSKPRNDYNRDGNRADGLYCFCRGCQRESNYQTRLRKFKADPWDRLYARKKARAKQEGLPFTLTEKWVRERLERGCPISGVPFYRVPPQPPGSPSGAAGTHPMAPSFDQIVPGQGYTPGNTQIVAFWINTAKGQMSTEELIELCQFVCDHNDPEKVGGN